MRRILLLLLSAVALAGCIHSGQEVLTAEESTLLDGVGSGVYFSVVEGERGDEFMVEEDGMGNEYVLLDDKGEPATIVRFSPLAPEIYLVQMQEAGNVDLYVVHSSDDGILVAIPWDQKKCMTILEQSGLSVSDSTINDTDLDKIKKGLLAWSDAAKGAPVSIIYLSAKEYGDLSDDELRELLQDRATWPGSL